MPAAKVGRAAGERQMAGTARVALALTAAVCFGVLAAVVPLRCSGHTAARLSGWSRPLRPPQHPPVLPVLATAGQSESFDGTPAIGALFDTTAGGQPASHFCTASVVDSPSRDLLVTAAHCVSGVDSGHLDFVPGYHDGQAPYGIWQVTHVAVDSNWASTASPDDDFAILTVSRPGGVKIQDITGGERLGTGQQAGQQVTVVGYPDAGDNPVACRGDVRAFSPTQFEFDCPGYTDGTSGGPMLADVDPGTGLGTVIGVIGGYQQGGDTAAVSYAAHLDTSAAALLGTASGAPAGQ